MIEVTLQEFTGFDILITKAGGSVRIVHTARLGQSL